MSLRVSNLCVEHNDRIVVNDVSLSVEPGKATAILGSNGAGKSELVLGIAGMLRVNSGIVMVDDKDITNKTPDFIRACGVAAVPEGHRVLTQLSVDENLRAAGAIQKSALGDSLIDTYQRFPELVDLKSQLAGTLSGGQQQMLALGHALMCKPAYLLIDEMSLGLAPVIVKRLMVVVSELKSAGVGIVLIEQFTELALGIADDAVVLRNGTVRYSGPAAQLRDDQSLLDNAYFGTEA